MTSHGAPDLALTGERTLPGIPRENYWFRRHEVAYREVAGLCAGAVVLEAGCGEGYGANLLAAEATRVIALDYDRATAVHVAGRYPGVHAVLGNLVVLPLGPSTVDVVVSLQVIEHLWDQQAFLAECARVLRAGGRLLLSTPNRVTFTPGRDTPVNPFHTRELSAAEIAGLLTGAGFRLERLAGVHHGPRLRQLDARHGGSIVDAQLAPTASGQSDTTASGQSDTTASGQSDTTASGQSDTTASGQSDTAANGQWPAGLLADVASVSTSDFVVTAGNLDASLDLLAVAVRP